MNKVIVDALRAKLETKEINFNPAEFEEDAVLILGLQCTMEPESFGPNGWFLNLMACVLSEQYEAVRALVWREDNVKNIYRCLDHLYETVFIGHMDPCELQELKDQVYQITY